MRRAIFITTVIKVLCIAFGLAVIWLWGLRLGGYLFFARIIKGKVEKRYEDIGKEWKSEKIGFLLNYMLQGCLAWIVSLGLYSFFHGAAENLRINWLFIVVMVGSIIAQALADNTLHQFSKSNTKGVCDVGLWRYCRHPNLFFEFTFWLGLALLSWQSALFWLALLSPVAMYIIMFHVTGPITERGSLKRRGQAYKDYMKKTSYFFPWFVKKESKS